MNAETWNQAKNADSAMYMLQWGRVLMNAETTGRLWTSTASAGCFNGAAFS